MKFVVFIFRLFFIAAACHTLHASSCRDFSSYCQDHIEEVIAHYFYDTLPSDIYIEPMAGGHSNNSFLFIVNGSSYVLRIKDKGTSQIALLREVYVMQEAAKVDISPKILYVSKDYKAILMEYVEGGVSNIAQNKQPENCIKVANTFRKAHQIPRNPYFEEDSLKSVIHVYQEICNFPLFKKERLDEALALMWKYNTQLETFGATKVNTHGELNSRNIFLTGQGAVFIDWEYTGWEDPFSDLSYFALRVDYNEKEEMLLLESYLQRAPSLKEIEHYYIAKKLNLAQLCIYFHWFSLKFNRDKTPLNDDSPVKELSHYMSVFSDQQDDETLLAQYYYDLAKCCLNLAK